jgi:transposase InsO family protein
MWRTFIFLLTLVVRLLRAACKSRDELVLEHLALRQQVTALKLGRLRPKLHDADRAFWIALRRTWAPWTSRLLIVKPETVVDWQRRRFRRHWTRISQQGRRPGRPRVEAEIRDLIRQMVRQNHWGAPRILSELLLKQWISFLRNHKDAIAGMDLFTVPTATLNVLYGFFVIHHDRRRILHFNATYHPTAQWVMQQLREAFPFNSVPRHLIFDRDAIFCPAVVEFVKALGVKPRRIAYRSPWHNPVAERWIGSLRRELLDHVVVLSQQHLIRLVKSFIRYYHEDRCHLGLGRDTPEGRPVTPNPSPDAKVVALPRVGGLHHRYVWREAA